MVRRFAPLTYACQVRAAVPSRERANKQMYSVDKDILCRLAEDEKVIDQLWVEMITERFSKRMFKMAYGPSGAIAPTTDRIIFVGRTDEHNRVPDALWEVPLSEVRGAVYYPATLQVFTHDQ